MNIWRMKLRAGDYGDDMWPHCQLRGIASMTHPPSTTPTSPLLTKNDVDESVKTATRSTINSKTETKRHGRAQDKVLGAGKPRRKSRF